MSGESGYQVRKYESVFTLSGVCVCLLRVRTRARGCVVGMMLIVAEVQLFSLSSLQVS